MLAWVGTRDEQGLFVVLNGYKRAEHPDLTRPCSHKDAQLLQSVSCIEDRDRYNIFTT